MFQLAIITLISCLFTNNLFGQESLFDNVEDKYNTQGENQKYLIKEKSLQNSRYKPNLDYVANSSLPNYRDTNGKKTLVVNISKQKFGAYDSSGNLVKSGRVSTAKRGYKTKRGTFNNIQKRGGSSCWSSKYQVGIPYCMFYYAGFALHGFHDVPNYPASHGCIRLTIESAKWLHNQFVDNNTVLIVH